MKTLWLFLLSFAALSVATTASPTRRICMQYNVPKKTESGRLGDDRLDSHEDSENEFDNYSDDDTVEQNFTNIDQKAVQVICKSPFDFCFALFSVEKNGFLNVSSQGCWQHDCNQSECVGDQRANVFFCCCNADKCNNDLTYIAPRVEPIIDKTQQTKPKPQNILANNPVVWVSITSTTIMLIVIAIVFFVSCQVKSRGQPETKPLAPSGPGYSSNLYNVDNLKPISIVGEGKYGTVWKGMVNDQSVAVKIFNASKKQYFLNEKDIYTQPFMDTCPSLLTYFGCDERLNSDGKIEYMLVLSLSDIGNLQDYLRKNSTTFQIYCRMAISIAKGVSHLHTRIQKADIVKMCIAHRDLNSRNILVKPDLTCCLCDFGFAMKVNGPRYEYQGEMILAETKSIYEAGTMRYMAPEILEGAVNLRDCEISLKQIDVYSLGLVLWELCMRCKDFYPPEMETPPYKAPYEAEIGVHPSFDQMRSLVLQHKARPLFPPYWGGGLAAHASKEVCEDLWDHDPDARLTSVCAEERLIEVATLKPRSHHMPSATPLNTTNLIQQSQISSISPLIPPNNQVITQIEITCDTMLSSPSSDYGGRIAPIKNHEMFGHQIQQFQGRNLCLERNLVQIHQADQSNEDKPIKKCPLANGNHLIRTSGNENFYGDLEYEVLVEELITKNMTSNAPPSTSPAASINTEILPKKNNADKKSLARWKGVRDMIQKKFQRNNQENLQQTLTSPTNRKIHLSMIDTQKPNNVQRPRVLEISPIVVSREMRRFKTPPHDTINETFTVIRETPPKIVTSKSATLHTKSDESSESSSLKRQRSLEVFRDVFGPAKGSVERLRDVHQRIKTPGDVPASVRKIRASKTLSLYDDRMMDSTHRFDGSSNSM